MNIELWKSWTLKLLPVVAAYFVGKGMVSQETVDQLPALVEWIAAGLLLIPTLVRSWKNYGPVKLEKAQ
jgi:hypothetical protein